MSGRLIYHPKHVMGQNAGKQNSIEQVYGIGLEGRFTDAQDVDEGMVPGGCLGSVGMYQLAALIEAVPRISPSRCTVKMHRRPTL